MELADLLDPILIPLHLTRVFYDVFYTYLPCLLFRRYCCSFFYVFIGGLCSLLTCSIWKMQNNSNNPTASQGAATSESNNLPIARPSSGSAFAKPKSFSGSKDIELTEQSILMRGESGRTAATTKADLEQLAQNRGNAMLRYKEKKKTRRYVLPFSSYLLTQV